MSLPAPVRLYGIPHCDTVKKARRALADAGVAAEFVDVKRTGIPPADLDAWLSTLGWEALVNRRGTTWRGLSPEAQAAVVDAVSARAALLAHTSLMKRPVVAWADGAYTVGYDAAAWAQRLDSVGAGR